MRCGVNPNDEAAGTSWSIVAQDDSERSVMKVKASARAQHQASTYPGLHDPHLAIGHTIR